MEERDFKFERLIRRVGERFYIRYIDGLRKAVKEDALDSFIAYVQTQEQGASAVAKIRRMASAVEKGYDK